MLSYFDIKEEIKKYKEDKYKNYDVIEPIWQMLSLVIISGILGIFLGISGYYTFSM